MKRKEPQSSVDSSEDVLLDVDGITALLRIATDTVYRQVRLGRLPAPVYPAPSSRRWFKGEVLAAVRATQSLPSQNTRGRGRPRKAAVQS